MIICTVNFNNNNLDFDDMLKVWELSAKKYMPDATIKILTVNAPEKKKRMCDKYMTYSSSYAFLKMADWIIKQNDNCILTDADIFFTGDCRNVFDYDFDIACTVRNTPCWVNAGVAFYKPEGKKYLQKWINLTNKMVEDPEKYKKELRVFLGADQAALAVLTEKYNFLRLPCEIWNSEQHSWDKFSDDTKIVHVKSSLGQLARGEPMGSEYPEDHNIFKIYKLWRGYLD